MAPKTKLCLGCNQQFEGRPNAKACSSKCRKRIFRAKQAISREVNKLAELRAEIHDDLRNSLQSPQLAPVLAAEDLGGDGTTSLSTDNLLPNLNGLNRSEAVVSWPASNQQPKLAFPDQTIIKPSVPAPAAAQPPPQPTVQPESTILSLENRPDSAPAPTSLFAMSPASSPSAPVSTPTLPPLRGLSSEGIKLKLLPQLRRAPFSAALAALMLVVVMTGVFASSKLFNQPPKSTPVAATHTNQPLH